MRVNWNLRGSDLDEFDRSRQYTPYTGPVPTNNVYQFKLKIFRYVKATADKWEQIRIGMELVPRNGREDEQRYAGYFLMVSRSLADKNRFTYVPFFDALGISGRDLDRGVITDEEGNVKKIGSWRNSGDLVILAKLADSEDAKGNPRKDFDWFGPLKNPHDELPEDDPDIDDDDESDDEYEPEPAPVRRRSTGKARPTRRATSARKTRSPIDDDDEEVPF